MFLSGLFHREPAASVFQKRLKKDFEALQREPGMTHMILAVDILHKGREHYIVNSVPKSCNVVTIGVHKECDPLKMAFDLVEQDIPTIATFTLHDGRSFEEQLKKKRIMESYPDITASMKNSLHGLLAQHTHEPNGP